MASFAVQTTRTSALGDKLLAEPLRQPLTDQARRDVGRAAESNPHSERGKP
jgi:hypothetical protein